MSKNYDVTIKWHTPDDETVRETVVKTWASSPKLADKIGLRGARLDRTVPQNAIIDAPANEPLRVVEPEPTRVNLDGDIDDAADHSGVAEAAMAGVVPLQMHAIMPEPAEPPQALPTRAEHGPAARPLSELLSEMESQLGEDFLETKAWRRVRARVAALTRQSERAAA